MSTTFWRDEPTVFAVDRETAFCQTLIKAGERVGLSVEFFASCQAFLEAVDPARRGCAAIDPEVPRCNVSELIAKLTEQAIYLPVLIVSARCEVPWVVEAMRSGALNYLQKPCETESLATALREAVAWDAQYGRRLVEAARDRRRMGRLTPGERQVLEMLVQGMTNQQVAAALGLSVRTIEVRRAKIRDKMRTKNLANLIRQSVTVDLGPTLHTGG
jgi:two-component system, LuxR family, response regulator FixJ